MSTLCDEYLAWLADREDPDGPPPDILAEHLASCPKCADLAGRYEGARSGFQAATSSSEIQRPDFETIRSQVDSRDAEGTQQSGVPKWVWTLVPAAASLVLLFVWLKPVPSEHQQAPVATVVGSGESSIVSSEGRAAVTSPKRLEAGSIVETVSGGEAVIAGAPEFKVRVAGRTSLKVISLRPRETVLHLNSGRIEAKVGRTESRRRFEVRTPFAVVRVKGTEFIVTHRQGVETTVVGVSGRVEVETLAGALVAGLSAGESVTIPDPRFASLGTRPPAGQVVRDRRDPVAQTVPSTTQRPAAISRPKPPLTDQALENLMARARVLLSSGQEQEAIGLMANAIVSPGTGRARLMALLGDAYRLAERPQEARKAYEQSLIEDSSPSSGSVLNDLADLLNETLGLREEAIGVWKRCLQDYPRCPTSAEMAQFAVQS